MNSCLATRANSQMENKEQSSQDHKETLWEYRVININIINKKQPQNSSPEEASQKLQGMLSPEFIKQEFPKLYEKPSLPKHPASQLQYVLNLLGRERWELIESSQLGGLLVFIFKRKSIKSERLNKAQKDSTQETT